MNENKPVSKGATEYADKLFPHTEPCDSWGICEGCFQRTIFLAGYNFGYRAGEEELQAKCDRLKEEKNKFDQETRDYIRLRDEAVERLMLAEKVCDAVRGNHSGCNYLADRFCNKCGRFPIKDAITAYDAAKENK
jgi:hypothetical protein